MHDLFLAGLRLVTATDPAPSMGIWAGLKYLLTQLLELLFTFTKTIGLPNYALAILLFTIIIKTVLYPLSIKQMRSTREMQKVQPKITEINEKYKNDPQKKNAELAKIYQEEGINPLSGCLPLLLQMPILFALFQVLRELTPVYPEYNVFFWVRNLAEGDPLILPILVAAASFGQQFLTSTNRKDPSQRMMLFIFPLMFAWIARTMPAGLSLYWIYQSFLTVLQQWIINKQGVKQDAIEAEKKAVLEEEKKKQEAKIEEEKATLSQEMREKIAVANTSKRKLKRKK
ncbi:MAG: YidC/Oxa1 family membrane protein insertase [Clostridiales bacterium]|nr:YidC/Oxa1 family membrane protein insertase [Clostridiales bacterium]